MQSYASLSSKVKYGKVEVSGALIKIGDRMTMSFYANNFYHV